MVDKEDSVLERYDLAMESVAIETDPSDFGGDDNHHHGKLFSESEKNFYCFLDGYFSELASTILNRQPKLIRQPKYC